MSLAKLTSLSTKTLSLLLERQRLQTLPSFSSPSPGSNPLSSPSPPPKGNANGNSLHLRQITQHLAQLRKGILELEAREGKEKDAAVLLRGQYERMRGMLGVDGEGVPSLEPEPERPREDVEVGSSSSKENLLPAPPLPLAKDVGFTPYTDDPEQGLPEPGIMLQTQRQMMDEQDHHLDQLSHSITRQHHISLQINDELDVHAGLLEELDTDLDRTGGRLSGARKRLDRVAKGAKENGSTVMIALLILVLLILIIVFKT